MDRITSAYVIPYVRDDKGAVHVLAAQKQVISYEAVQGYLQGRMSSVFTKAVVQTIRQCLQQNQLLLNSDGTMTIKGVGKRFNGMLLSGCGKPTFPGGRCNKREPAKDAAIREFEEEFNCKGRTKDLGVLEEPLVIDSAYYYPLHVNDVSLILKLADSVNVWIGGFNEKLKDNLNALKGGNFPELRRVDLISVDTASAFFGNIDLPYIGSQIRLFSRFFCENLSVGEDAVQTNLAGCLRSHAEHHESIDWHQRALAAFHTRLRPPLSESIVPVAAQISEEASST